MDVFELLALQHRDVRQRQMDENWQQIRALREKEALAAEQRAADLQAIEDERQQHLRRRLSEQQAQERRLLTLAVVVVGLFLIVLIVLVLTSVVR